MTGSCSSRNRRRRRTAGWAPALAIPILLIFASSASAAQFVVTGLGDTGPFTLRDAITQANAVATNDEIVFASFVPDGTIQLNSALPAIANNGSLTITGPGADRITVRGEGAADPYRIFTINAGATVTISGLTISNGAAATGGGIFNSGNLSLVGTVVSGNEATGFGGGIRNAGGSSLLIRDSTISDNETADPASGGGIDSSGGLTIRNSTITGNTANGAGAAGGVFSLTSTTAIENSTIASNTNTSVTGAANFRRDSGATVTITSSIIANPLGGGVNCTSGSGSTTSGGFNLESANTCGLGQPTDQTGAFPALGPLQDNGGPTPTLALIESSPALDRGIAVSGISSDQRGCRRPVDLPFANAPGGDGTDVGAFERQDAGPIEVTSLANAGDGSLRQAISFANCTNSTDGIIFNAGLSGTIQLESQLPVLDSDISIEGPGASRVTLRGENLDDPYSIFVVRPQASVEIAGLTISNGAGLSSGGAILVNGSLDLSRSVLSGNFAQSGAGLFVASNGTATVRDSTISGNTSNINGVGVGIDVFGTLAVRNSTISGNTGVGPFTAAGILSSFGGTVTVVNSTIAANTTGVQAGANVAVRGGTLAIRSSIVADPLGSTVNCKIQAGALSSLGFNLDTDGTCPFTQQADQQNASPALGPLADNGGPTPTMALGTSSAALDAGLGTTGITTDQRGLPRLIALTAPEPLGGDGTDIGAFEAQDADADGLHDAADNCPSTSNPDQTDTDGDAQGDACDADDDNDGVEDAADQCELLAGPGPSGCPAAERTLSRLKFAAAGGGKKDAAGRARDDDGPDLVQGTFTGKLTSSVSACATGVRVTIFAKRPGRDRKLGSPKTKPNTRFKLRARAADGTYYALVKAAVIEDVAACSRAKSKPAKVE